MKKTIALVGHCGPDASMIRSAIRTFLPEAQFVTVNDDRGLAEAAASSDLLLVNRVLDGRFAVETGGELLQSLRRAGVQTAFMLVSDIPEAQAEAERLGARKGFGKRQLRGEAMQTRLMEALQQAAGADGSIDAQTPQG